MKNPLRTPVKRKPKRTPVKRTESIRLLQGKCEEVMRSIPDNSIDAVVCDPPYGLEFMGKEFDKLGEGEAQTQWHLRWTREAFRVLKPGGFILAFGGTRTYHRLAVAIEDAGFEIRDQIQWLYGSGFPKSLNVSKAIDKAAGAEREVVGFREKSNNTVSSRQHLGETDGKAADGRDMAKAKAYQDLGGFDITAPATEAAKQWDGWGTALKPANEPICVARKPLGEKTVAANVLRHGTGALNIDGCRIGTTVETWPKSRSFQNGISSGYTAGVEKTETQQTGAAPPGRWPANVILSHSAGCELIGTKDVKGAGHWTQKRETGDGNIYSGGWGRTELDEGNKLANADGMETVEAYQCAPGCPVAELDRQSGVLKSGGGVKNPGKNNPYGNDRTWSVSNTKGNSAGVSHASTGGASRFFYCAKASKAERDAGLEDRVPEIVNDGRQTSIDNPYQRGDTLRQNTHPTVKPIKLMRYLSRLVCRPGGVVLDPFMGSGTTGIACKLEGLRFIGIEMNPEYFAIAEKRIAHG